jgi:hypothetical protein
LASFFTSSLINSKNTLKWLFNIIK